jgi:hypothetical protein
VRAWTRRWGALLALAATLVTLAGVAVAAGVMRGDVNANAKDIARHERAIGGLSETTSKLMQITVRLETAAACVERRMESAKETAR